MEYLNGGELFYHLKESNAFSEELTKFYAAEMILGLEALHKNGIIYRDLKPENIILNSEGHLKLTDFGLSKKGLDWNNFKSYSFVGTPEYLAPEIVSETGHDKAVDWWSLGVLIYEMLSGSPPFFGENKKALLKAILEEEIIFDKKFSVEATELLKNLLNRDPSRRLGSSRRDADEIKEHIFFKEIDWGALERLELRPPCRPSFIRPESEFEEDQIHETETESLAYKANIIYDGFSYQDNILNEHGELD